MREIKNPTMEDLGYKIIEGKNCPSCGERLYLGAVPCPDGKPGCLVLHYGYICAACGKKFTD